MLTVEHAGLDAIVSKNDGHPESYLWIDVVGKRFFLGVLTNRMSRGDVRRDAIAFLERFTARS